MRNPFPVVLLLLTLNIHAATTSVMVPDRVTFTNGVIPYALSGNFLEATALRQTFLTNFHVPGSSQLRQIQLTNNIDHTYDLTLTPVAGAIDIDLNHRYIRWDDVPTGTYNVSFVNEPTLVREIDFQIDPRAANTVSLTWPVTVTWLRTAVASVTVPTVVKLHWDGDKYLAWGVDSSFVAGSVTDTMLDAPRLPLTGGTISGNLTVNGASREGLTNFVAGSINFTALGPNVGIFTNSSNSTITLTDVSTTGHQDLWVQCLSDGLATLVFAGPTLSNRDGVFTGVPRNGWTSYHFEQVGPIVFFDVLEPVNGYLMSLNLDTINTTRGAILYRAANGWTNLNPGTAGYVLTAAGAGADPNYLNPATLTNTLQNQTFDAAATGNVLKFKSYVQLVAPHRADGVGAVIYTNDFSQPFWGHALFSGTAATNANWIEYRLTVPDDIDTSVDLKARWKVRLNGADTAASTYTVGMASVATSASYDSPTLGNYVTLTVAADASGASGDVESVANVTLTGWAAGVTAGQLWVIRVARDGAGDASTVAHYDAGLTLEYGASQ